MLALRRFCLSWPPALLAVLLLLSSGLAGAGPIRASAAPASTITGTVFQDYNANGVQDTSPAVDSGVAGVAVTAYAVVAGATQQVGQTTSGANGAYALTTSDSGSGPYRIEFTNLPAGFNPGPVGSGAGGTVQFVSANGVANLGLVMPANYSQNDPLLLVNRYVPAKNVTPGPNSEEYTLLGIPFSGSGNPGLPAPVGIAKAKQVGATWGLAYQGSSKTIFAAAYLKRHIGFGPGGTGAIYAIQAGADLTLGSPDDTIATFLDLDALFPGSTGANPHATGDEAMNDFTCIVGGTGNCWFWDANAFAPVGKLSLGDIDLSDDGLTLFVVNMYDRKLYEIPIGDPPTAPGAGSITAVAMPTSLPNSGPNALPAGSGSNQHQGCAEADVRPMGTGFFDGKLYAGMVCSAQTSKLRTDLRAYVYAYDPATQQFGTAPVVEFPLDYVHGNIPPRLRPRQHRHRYDAGRSQQRRLALLDRPVLQR